MKKGIFFLMLMVNSHVATSGILLDLYNTALDNNPTLLSRQYQIDQVAAREDQALSRLLPQVTANGNYSLNRFNSEGQDAVDYDGLRGTVQASQTLFDLAAYYRFKGSEASTRQSEQEHFAYQMELAGELLDRYLMVLEANDKIISLNEEKHSVKTQLKRLRYMIKRQMVRVTDLYEVEAYDNALNTQIIEANNEKAISLESIRELTTILPEKIASLETDSFPAVPSNIDQWVSKAIINNPNLLALKEALGSAQELMSASDAGHFPQLRLQLSETYSDQSFDNRQSPPYDVGSATLQLTVPIYSGGRISAESREAHARYKQLFQEYERVRREIEKQTRTTFLNAVSGDAKIKSTLDQYKAEKKVTESLQKSYELGVSTIVDLLESRRDSYRARTEHQKACYDYVRSLIALKIWSGGLSQKDIEQIDKWFVI